MSTTTDGPPCDLPPAGWACSRGAGHDGPCAPYPIDATGTCPPDRNAATANASLSLAVEACAETVRTIAVAAGALIEAIDEARADADTDVDALGVGAQAAQQLGQAADLWTGIAVGLAETRQRILAGADRTIKVEADGGDAS